MNLYEFTTPSDPITFYAPDNDIAFAATLLVGNGQAFCDRVKEEGGREKVEGCELYLGSVPKEVLERLKNIIDTRKDEISSAFKTFAVCAVGCRKEYDVYTDNSQNEERWKEWDDRKRSSCSDWCGRARRLKFKE